MVKKIAALAGAGAILLSMAVPAFAWFPMFGSSDVAIVTNSASAVANTGNNDQGNAGINVGGNNSMTTGYANAYAGALVVANTHVGCGPCAGGGWGHKDFAMVRNGAGAVADSGNNDQGNAGINVGGNNSMTTRDAGSTARAWTIVNTHLSLF